MEMSDKMLPSVNSLFWGICRILIGRIPIRRIQLELEASSVYRTIKHTFDGEFGLETREF